MVAACAAFTGRYSMPAAARFGVDGQQLVDIMKVVSLRRSECLSFSSGARYINGVMAALVGFGCSPMAGLSPGSEASPRARYLQSAPSTCGSMVPVPCACRRWSAWWGHRSRSLHFSRLVAGHLMPNWFLCACHRCGSACLPPHT